jgi:hypothetical protein
MRKSVLSTPSSRRGKNLSFHTWNTKADAFSFDDESTQYKACATTFWGNAGFATFDRFSRLQKNHSFEVYSRNTKLYSYKVGVWFNEAAGTTFKLKAEIATFDTNHQTRNKPFFPSMKCETRFLQLRQRIDTILSMCHHFLRQRRIRDVRQIFTSSEKPSCSSIIAKYEFQLLWDLIYLHEAAGTTFKLKAEIGTFDTFHQTRKKPLFPPLERESSCVQLRRRIDTI